VPGRLDVTGSVVTGCAEVGIAVLGAEATIASTAIEDVAARSTDGLFGDGIAVVFPSTHEATSAMIDGCRVGRSARAGITSFGADVRVSGSTLECNPIHLDGESSAGEDHHFQDEGGNRCGCDGAEASCTVLSTDLAPPAPLP
jgi:hypothetical protein